MNLFIYLFNRERLYPRIFLSKAIAKVDTRKSFWSHKASAKLRTRVLSTVRSMCVPSSFCPPGLLSVGAFIRWGFYPLGLLSVGAFIRGLFSAGLLSVGLLSAGLLSAPHLGRPIESLLLSICHGNDVQCNRLSKKIKQKP